MNWKAAGYATAALCLLVAWWAALLLAPTKIAALIGLATVILPAFWLAFYQVAKIVIAAKQPHR